MAKQQAENLRTMATRIPSDHPHPNMRDARTELEKAAGFTEDNQDVNALGCAMLALDMLLQVARVGVRLDDTEIGPRTGHEGHR